jgi:hypothetical protein
MSPTMVRDPAELGDDLDVELDPELELAGGFMLSGSF